MKKQDRPVYGQKAAVVTEAIKRELGNSGISLDLSPLGVFKLKISDPAVCDYLINHHPEDETVVGNRNAKTAQIQRLEDALARGEWDPDNGETIKIAVNEYDEMMLIDGQHRLKAIKNYLSDGGEPVEVTVICGMDPQSVLTVDTGSGRSIADFLTICESTFKTYATDVASAGRDLFRSRHNLDEHPMRKPNEAYSEGDMAGWLMSTEEDGTTVARGLHKIREQFADCLNLISRKDMFGNAGARSWMTFLAYEWYRVDPKLTVEVLQYLASAQDVDLPDGNNLWKYARAYCVQVGEQAQGFKAANKAVHDLTLVAYASAWNLHRKRQKANTKISGAVSFQNYVEERFWKRRETNSGYVLAKVPEWPGVL
jgi:hypothetical protein